MKNKREPLNNSEGVRIEKIYFHGIIRRFNLLFVPKLKSLFGNIHIKNVGQFKKTFGVIIVLFLIISTFSQYSFADTTYTSLFSLDEDVVSLQIDNTQENVDIKIYNPITAGFTVNSIFFKIFNAPPQEIEIIIAETITVPATAYSSTQDQTDGNPFITASGKRVRDGIVAANFLPLGTELRIPEHYGDKIFVVEDRMNSRYWEVVDIWMPTRAEALKFGVRNVKIEILN